MVSVLIFCYDKHLAEELHNMCSYSTALMGNDVLSVEKYVGIDISGIGSVESNRAVELIFYEVRSEKDSHNLFQLRRMYPEAEIVIVASHKVFPEYYLTLDIRPSAYLPDPCEKEKRKEQIHNLFLYLFRKRMEIHSDNRFVIDTDEGKRFLLYDRIICFEAFEKKIKVYYGNEQLSFYGTLKELEVMLPSCFVRCHRSYIINSMYVNEMNHKHNTIILENKLVIPISKKYKNKMIHETKKQEKLGTVTERFHK